MGKRLSLDEIELLHGSHTSPEEGMCVMEAVAYDSGFDSPYGAAYRILKPFYAERYKAMFGELGLKQSVLALVDRLIDVSGAPAE